MLNNIYNHHELCNLIFYGNTQDAIATFLDKSKFLLSDCPTMRINYLSSLNYSIYYHILIHEQVSLHKCCHENTTLIRTLTTDTFQQIGEEILQSYANCKDYLIEKHKNTYIKFTLTYIHEHLGESISLNELCKELHLNKCYLCELFRKEVSMTLGEYILQQRIQRSICLLKTTSISVHEVATKCGFQTSSYFCSCFKKITQTTPLQYRKQMN